MQKSILKDYFNYIEVDRGFSKNTLESYKRDIKQFLAYIEKSNLESIIEANKTEIIKYLMHLQDLGRANSTISRSLASLRSLFQYLLNNDLVNEDPTFNLKSSPTRRKVPSTLTLEEVQILIEQPNVSTKKGIRDRAMIHLISTTGLRVSQMLDLNLNDMDLQEGFVKVREGDIERNIPIDKYTVKSIEDYIEKSRSEKAKGDALFVNLYGNRLSRQGFWKILREYAEKTGIEKKITPHTLRHSFAYNMINKGVDIKDVQEILGHSDVSTTEIYLYKN